MAIVRFSLSVSIYDMFADELCMTLTLTLSLTVKMSNIQFKTSVIFALSVTTVIVVTQTRKINNKRLLPIRQRQIRHSYYTDILETFDLTFLVGRLGFINAVHITLHYNVRLLL